MFNRCWSILLATGLSLFATAGRAQVKDVGIHIVQDDSDFAPEATASVIKLHKKSFKIYVLLQYTTGVYVFASQHDSLFRLPAAAPVPGFERLRELVMPEEDYNKEKELVLNDAGWSYWYYEPGKTGHRFNKKIVLLDSGRVVGTRSVKQVYLPSQRKEIKLKEIESPLYLFFLAVAETDAAGNPRKELLRRIVKIEWLDAD